MAAAIERIERKTMVCKPDELLSRAEVCLATIANIWNLYILSNRLHVSIYKYRSWDSAMYILEDEL